MTATRARSRAGPRRHRSTTDGGSGRPTPGPAVVVPGLISRNRTEVRQDAASRHRRTTGVSD
ncbi:MAG TPA: hypothetical protein VK402_04965 [Blastococcus sp.]|nr:hypothetical protein [Blastococcus sp.]